MIQLMNWLFRKMLNDSALESELGLRNAATAIQYVPIDAIYVTMVQASQVDFNSLSTTIANKNAGFIVGRNETVVGDGEAGYLFHDGVTLSMVTPSNRMFDMPLASIQATKIVPVLNGWAIAVLYDNVGYIFDKFVSIKNDPTHQFNTAHGVQPDVVFGWQTQLKQYGVTV
jgi:hypothetical protein